MITIENVDVYNIARAVYSARNALNSWDKSDSDLSGDILGEADLTLARRLCRAGSDHRKFLRQIMVSMDITAPLYWWKEFDTYKVGTVANSCSTMHTIHKRELTMEDFSCEKLLPRSLYYLAHTINEINLNRDVYVGWDNQTADIRALYCDNRETAWEQMIQLLPSSYNQRRTVTLNYEVLLNMYNARKNHKIDEWRELRERIKTLPYFTEICLEGVVNGSQRVPGADSQA